MTGDTSSATPTEESTNQLFWVVSKEDAEKRPTFTVPLKLEKAGTYNVKLKMFVGGDFGKFSITLGGKTVTDSG